MALTGGALLKAWDLWFKERQGTQPQNEKELEAFAAERGIVGPRPSAPPPVDPKLVERFRQVRHAPVWGDDGQPVKEESGDDLPPE